MFSVIFTVDGWMFESLVFCCIQQEEINMIGTLLSHKNQNIIPWFHRHISHGFYSPLFTSIIKIYFGILKLISRACIQSLFELESQIRPSYIFAAFSTHSNHPFYTNLFSPFAPIAYYVQQHCTKRGRKAFRYRLLYGTKPAWIKTRLENHSEQYFTNQIYGDQFDTCAISIPFTHICSSVSHTIELLPQCTWSAAEQMTEKSYASAVQRIYLKHEQSWKKFVRLKKSVREIFFPIKQLPCVSEHIVRDIFGKLP